MAKQVEKKAVEQPKAEKPIEVKVEKKVTYKDLLEQISKEQKTMTLDESLELIQAMCDSFSDCVSAHAALVAMSGKYEGRFRTVIDRLRQIRRDNLIK